MTRRVGVLGGTFDPIHCGHVDLGRVAERALGLDTLLVVPSYAPPHRTAPQASLFHRFAMAALTVAGHERWQASDVELAHAEPSYTSTTLQRLHAAGYAPGELFFVIGVDAFAEITSWKNYPAILEFAHFAVVSRPGHPSRELPARIPALASRMTTDAPHREPHATTIFLIDAPTADVSSTAIRQRRREGRPIGGLVPPLVEQHIERHGLYRSASADRPESAGVMNPAAGRLHGQG